MTYVVHVKVKPGGYRFIECVYFETMLAVHSFRIAITRVWPMFVHLLCTKYYRTFAWVVKSIGCSIYFDLAI